ncbi:Rid family hydrolase [Glycomyces dulcitolivorans]|uniref:Rid family hydrolase n=1 Tax=Glycomyces dulcitolivorans TaxID=2200759 RepID=UPI000DD42239|nr:Rid family hydrolase [Glycomyces dulcitolivorans]
MGEPQFHITPGFGEKLHDLLGYSQAVRIGDRVEISGQGGWNDDIEFPEDLDEEIARAFDNVERTLATAGATWADVVEVDSYHLPDDAAYIGERPTRAMAEQFRKRMGDRAPIWTQIGVAALGAPGMRVEIRVTAIVGHAA